MHLACEQGHALTAGALLVLGANRESATLVSRKATAHAAVRFASTALQR